MSILLEALRKSEKNQHAPAAPNIHSDDQPGLAPDSVRTGPLALMLVAALFASGWFVWQQYQPPVAIHQPPVNPDAEQVVAETPTTTNPVAAGGKTVPLAATNTAANKTAGKARTPVESFQATMKALQPGLARQKPASQKPARQNAINNDPVKQLTDDSNTRSTARTVASNKPVEPAPEQRRRSELAPISYWELPDAIRADVAEIKYSVLVYSNRPAERFVLVNGQRLEEGDSPQPGLVVKEIRRDGVVFSYRLYQFLVER